MSYVILFGDSDNDVGCFISDKSVLVSLESTLFDLRPLRWPKAA